jgi:hypothetical protein
MKNEKPFFCLLEDDNLISKVSINSDRLLSSTADKNYVCLIIKVKTRRISGTWGNLRFA